MKTDKLTMSVLGALGISADDLIMRTERLGLAMKWALDHSTDDGRDELEVMAHAIRSLRDASELLAGSDLELACGLESLAVWFAEMIEAEKDFQELFTTQGV